ncbi:MAG TPA: hypothetical protein DCZ80_04195 [Legionellales bacterium]|nr:hypothetical protein [Legionellales bacterium]
MHKNDSTLPSLLEYTKFFKLFEHHQLKPFLPEPFRVYSETISQVKGSPFYGLIGAMVDCASGLFLFALGGILAKSFTSLSPLERYVLAASPMLPGGCLRIWAAAQSDKGQGKQAILNLLGVSLLGVLGHAVMLSMAIDLSSINTRNSYYYLFLINNILTGAGIATYSAGMALGAQAAPHDDPTSFFKHLELSSEKLGQSLQVNCTEKSLAPIIRNQPRQYLALIACASNFAPGMTLVTASFLMPIMGLRNTYVFFAGMTGLGMLTTWFCVENSILDQLKQIDPALDTQMAKEIATYMGQRIFPSTSSFYQRFQDLEKKQKSEIFKATIDYTLTFGLLSALTAIGPIILQNKGATLTQSVLTMAGVSMLSSLMRGVMVAMPSVIKTEYWMLSALGIMMIGSFVLKFAEDISLIQANMLLFGIFNGIGNFCVVDRVSYKIPQEVGLATGISSGIAAFLAFPMSIIMAQENNCFMGICALGFSYHLYQNMIEHCKTKTHAKVHGIEMSPA